MKDNKETKDIKNSVLKEALADYQEIKEAADKNAKQKLATEFPDKFNALLKEELQKNNKESDNKTDNINESAMKKDDKVTKVTKVTKDNKKPLNEGGELNMTGLGMSEVEEAYNDADKNDQFNISLDDIEKEISEMEQMSQKMSTDALPHGTSNEYEELKRLYEEIGQILADKDTKDSSKTGVVGEETTPEPNIDQLKKEGRWQEVAEIYESMMNEKGKVNEDTVNVNQYQAKQKSDMGVKGDSDQNKALDSSLPKVNEDNVDIDKYEATPNKNAGSKLTTPKEKEAPEQVVDEILSQSLSANKQVSGNMTPRAEDAASFKQPKLRYALRNEAVQTKFTKLLEENKKIIKNLNETKASFKKANTLVEGYKNALEKYRKQLSEMAVFNSNLANVNNLLVNEELALTTDDKIKIINEFKKINSITDSKKKYGEFLTEMKKGKKTISEGIEEKVAVSVQPSSKQKLDEVTEKTAYQDNTHLGKIKSMMAKLDKRDKKNNI